MGGKLGTCLGKPATDKINEEGEGNGLRYGAASMQGWRATMEDALCARAQLDGAWAAWGFFAVFDGHAGAGIAAHCATELLPAVAREPAWAQGPDGPVAEALRSAFLQLDATMRAAPLLRHAGGSTAVAALLGPRRLLLANCGDSRAVLCRAGLPALATRDHKPELPDEAARIRRAGGTVLVSRLNGTLAVSRALGDFDYKTDKSLGQCEQLVSPEPEVTCWERDDADEFLLLACDGVWDVMRNDEACSYVRSLLRITDDLVQVTNRLIDTCLSKGSDDNMSVILVTFPGAPKPTPEACDADRHLDERIRKCITEMVQGGERVKKMVYQELHLIPDFLPGGGIHDKWTLIQQIMEEVGLINDDEQMSDNY